MTDPTSEPASRRTRGRKRAILVAKVVIMLAVVIGLAWAVKVAVGQWNAERTKISIQLSELDHAIATSTDSDQIVAYRAERDRLAQGMPGLTNLRWRWIAAASLFYALSLIPPAFLLRGALTALGETVRIDTAIAAQLIGHVGKYVPGKAMVIVLRSGVLAGDGIRLVAATISVFMETFLMMAVGAALAGAIICWLPVPQWMIMMALLASVCASLPTLPPVLKRVAAKVAAKDVDVASIDAARLFVTGWFFSLLAWVLIGAAFSCLVLAIPSLTELPPPLILYAVSTAAISLAMVAGFASLLPGGAGVRELVLATILGVAVGPAHGMLAAIAARLLFIGVEGAMAAAAWGWLRVRSTPTDELSVTTE